MRADFCLWPPQSYLISHKLNALKHLLIFKVLLFSALAMGQNPNYDPDANGDDLIGAEDLISFLAVYNTSVAVDTTLECDFDGTAEDEWLFDVINGEINIDSIVVQFSISDSANYYKPGCPTEQVYYLNIDFEYTLFPSGQSETSVSLNNYYDNPRGSNYGAFAGVRFQTSTGRAYFYFDDEALMDLKSSGPYNTGFNFSYNVPYMYACVNTPGNFLAVDLTEEGIVGNTRCDGQSHSNSIYGDAYYNYFRLLPYWHYAE